MMCHHDIRSLLCGTMLLIALPLQVAGSEFRSFVPIAVPPRHAAPAPGATATTAVTVPSTTANASAMRPVPRQLIGTAMDRLLAAWNGNRMDKVLGDEFFDKSRLSDAMNTKVPRDAELSLLAIQSVQTLGQKQMDSPSGRLLVSTVSITASTQLTFNDPTNGYQRREGVNEYIVRIKQLAQE